MQTNHETPRALFAHRPAANAGFTSFTRRENWLPALQDGLAQPQHGGLSLAAVSLAGASAEAQGYAIVRQVWQMAATLREAQACGISRLYVLFPSGGRDKAATQLVLGTYFCSTAVQIHYGIAESRELPRALQADHMALLHIAEARLHNKVKRNSKANSD